LNKKKNKKKVVSSLGAVPKGQCDIRLIHDLSRPNGGVNVLANDTSVSFVTLDDATSVIKPNGFLAKRDLQSAYRSVPIHPDDYNLTGLRGRFGEDEKFSYFYDSKLPFGAVKSCQVFQILTDALVCMVARQGMVAFAYIDDLLCLGDDEFECRRCYDTLISLIDELGLVVN
jgi:hypothetical protein